MPKTLQERVQAGAEFLDAEVPTWAERVDTDELEMASCDTCIIGQVFVAVGWDAAVKQLAVHGSGDWPADHGFDLYYEDEFADYAVLAELWRAEIRARVAAWAVEP